MMAGAASASGVAASKIKPFSNQLRKALIIYVFLIIAMSDRDRVDLSIAGPMVQKQFGLTNVQLGYIFSALWCGYALFQVPGGRLADRFGPRRILTLGMLWAGLFTALTGAVPSGSSIALLLLITVRFLLGAGIAVTFPASNRLVASWIPTAERGVANGIILGGVGVGSALAPPLATGITIAWGWRWAFFLRFPAAILMGLVWYWLARDTPQRHPWVEENELRRIEASVAPSARGTERAKAVRRGAIFGNRHILLVTASHFACYTASIFFTWFFKYLKDVRGLDLKASAFYCMLPFLGVTVCSPLGRMDFRSPEQAFWSARGQVWRGRGLPDVCRDAHRPRDASRERRTRKYLACLGNRDALPGTQFVLVGGCRHRGKLSRRGFGPDEYGRTGGRSHHGHCHVGDRRVLRLDAVVSGARGSLRASCPSLAAGRSSRPARDVKGDI